MKKDCNMCGTKIKNSKCECGTWTSKEELKDSPMLNAIEEFNDMKRFTCSAYAPHLECAMICFRGDYDDCKKVEKFIHELKNFPYYDE